MPRCCGQICAASADPGRLEAVAESQAGDFCEEPREKFAMDASASLVWPMAATDA
jgi:hypothetical protein